MQDAIVLCQQCNLFYFNCDESSSAHSITLSYLTSANCIFQRAMNFLGDGRVSIPKRTLQSQCKSAMTSTKKKQIVFVDVSRHSTTKACSKIELQLGKHIQNELNFFYHNEDKVMLGKRCSLNR